MNDASPAPSELRNALLSALPGEELRRLAPHLEKVSLRAGEVLHSAGEAARGVYFPEEGIASETLTTRDGRGIELAVIGSEGLMGERAVFGRWGMLEFRCVQFTDAVAHRIDPKVFRSEFRRSGVLQDLVLGRIEARLVETSQVALCAQLHTVEQRLARWLLTLAYRSHSDRFHVTHDYISSMLGVRRSTVSEQMVGLREAGIVEYSRNELALLDKGALEMGTCECYEVIRQATHAPLTEAEERESA